MTSPAGAPAARSWKYLGPKELRGLENLLFVARTVVEGAYAGRHRSPFKGSSSEFVDYREYQPGDELRSIDWKAYARSDRHFVKLFEKETDLNAYLLVDGSASMGYGGRTYKRFFAPAEVSKLEYAGYLAAALAYLMIQQGDKVGLTVFDQRIATHLPPGGTFPHLYRILRALENRNPARKTSVSRALRDAYGLIRRRGLLIVISDLIDDPVEIFRALSLYTHRHYEVVLFHVLHRYECELPPIPSVEFVDAETGEAFTANPQDLAKSYAAQMRGFVETMASLARARNIEYNFINTDTPPSAVLRRYLLRRGDR